MSEYTNALTIIRKIRGDRKNWEAGLNGIEEFVTAAEAAHRTVAAATQQVQEQQTLKASLTAENASLLAVVKAKRQELDALKVKLHR